MKNDIYIGYTRHIRLSPITHHFKYPIYMMNVDISETDRQSFSPVFSVNKFNLFNLKNKDYLIESSKPIREKFDELMTRYQIKSNYDELRLLTTPRLLRQQFNPVSFYYAYQKGELTLIVAEVTNTFKEKHLYCLETKNAVRRGPAYYFEKPKNFYVSPFSNDSGHFEFYLSDIKDDLDITISHIENDERKIVATLKGKKQPLNTANLLKLSFTYPLTAAKTMPRILWQAAKIHFLKNHKARKKPIPTDKMTVKKEKGSLMKNLLLKQFQKAFKAIKGSLLINYPNGESIQYGETTVPQLTLDIHSYDFFKKVLRAGDIGLADAYMDGDWSCNNLTALYELFVQNQDELEQSSNGSAIAMFLYKWQHKLRRNCLKNSRKNIQAHYDLGNDFYSLFLDKTMKYSCAYFESPNDSLQQAQENKIQKIINKLQLEPHHHVLEIGSGWGSQAIEIAKQFGCQVTSITLSEEQHRFATQRVKEEGLEKLVDIQLKDYRHLHQQYDRIVSIEMIEAVGHEFLETYVKSLDHNLKDDGIAVIQGITISDQHYQNYLKRSDFIQHYIFPGGHLPSLTEITKLLTQHSSLMVDHVENIGQHYALTLNRWNTEFQANKDEVIEVYGERFYKLWQLYFAYCEAGFSQRYIHTLQLVLTKAKNSYLIEKFNKEYQR